MSSMLPTLDTLEDFFGFLLHFFKLCLIFVSPDQLSVAKSHIVFIIGPESFCPVQVNFASVASALVEDAAVGAITTWVKKCVYIAQKLELLRSKALVYKNLSDLRVQTV